MNSNELTTTEDMESFKEIIKFSADAILSIDMNGNVVLFNEAAQNLFGYSLDEIIGKSLDVLLPKSVLGHHNEYVEEFASSADKTRMMGERTSVAGISKTGEQISLNISIQKHPETSQLKYSAICRDISDQIKSEIRLYESEEKFRGMFNVSHQIIILMDENGIVLDVNDRGRDKINGVASNVIGNKIGECTFWESDLDRTLIQDSVNNIKGDTKIGHIVNILGKYTEEITLDINIIKLPMPDGHDDLIVLEASDITEKVKTNNELMKSEERLSRAQRIAHIGNWVWEIPENIIHWSDEIYKIFGLGVREFEESYEAFLESVHPDDREKVEQAVIKSLESGETYSVIHRVVRPDGSERIVHEVGEVTMIDGNTPLRMDGTVQDITEAWNSRIELIEAKTRAEESNYAKAQFLATMSHELNTPLNAIIGFSSIMEHSLQNSENNDKNIEYIGQIMKSGQDLLGLIDNILNVSKLELGSLQPKKENFSILDAVEKSLAIAMGKSEEKAICFKKNIPDRMADVQLDKEFCEQIMINLLSNAIKFSDRQGTVEISVLPKDEYFEIVINDHGVGMADEELADLFEPFRNRGSSYVNTQEGAGLGLRIVQKLTEIQGGIIFVKSEKGVGTTVTVELPYVS